MIRELRSAAAYAPLWEGRPWVRHGRDWAVRSGVRRTVADRAVDRDLNGDVWRRSGDVYNNGSPSSKRRQWAPAIAEQLSDLGLSWAEHSTQLSLLSAPTPPQPTVHHVSSILLQLWKQIRISGCFRRSVFIVTRQSLNVRAWHAPTICYGFRLMVPPSDATWKRFCFNNTGCIERIRRAVRLCAI